MAKFAKFCKKSAKNSAIFKEKIEIRERYEGVHFVDLDESFQAHIYLQNLASIQPRTSPVKFARSSQQYPAMGSAGTSWWICETRLRWVSITAFGSPVVPEE